MLPDGYADIIIYNGKVEVHKDGTVVSKPFAYNTMQLEQELLQSPCSGQKLSKDEPTENALLPPLVVIFYEFLYEHCTLPTDKELVQHYIEHYFERSLQNPLHIKLKPAYTTERSAREMPTVGVMNRLLRMYPSLVRDLHFMMLCQESGSFSDVYYSVKQDYSYGYDLIVKRNGVKVFVRLMVETARSKAYNSKKFDRHKLNQKHVYELKMKLIPERKLGEFFLYNRQDVLTLAEYIDGLSLIER